jgi:acetyl-CoA carboxylase carboxyl transferase subunit alpha
VISPEGCASILWRTSDKAPEAAAAMKMSAEDLLALGVIDRIVPEPVGGAHRAPDMAIQALGDAIAGELDALSALPRDALLSAREEKFLGMGRA